MPPVGDAHVGPTSNKISCQTSPQNSPSWGRAQAPDNPFGLPSKTKLKKVDKVPVSKTSSMKRPSVEGRGRGTHHADMQLPELLRFQIPSPATLSSTAQATFCSTTTPSSKTKLKKVDKSCQRRQCHHCSTGRRRGTHHHASAAVRHLTFICY